MANKVTKVPGLKSKGMRIKPFEKLPVQANESLKKMPCQQLHGAEAKKIKSEKDGKVEDRDE